MNRSKANAPRPIDLTTHFYFLFKLIKLAPYQKYNNLSSHHLAAIARIYC